ncbi:MAG: hypothetical protein JSS32_06500 [Verrucomicrobia bacterium]|nr:hypothetical protein [Verrucomicrobiota bacterium]
MLHIAILCGGPSKERGISLNSARSFLDHTSSLPLRLHIFYLNPKGAYFQLQPSELYSNTPSDFDFKLAGPLPEKELIGRLKKMDLLFPLIHGTFGEDGQLQQFLEKHSIPYVGSPSNVCRDIFHKRRARELLAQHGFSVLPTMSFQTQEIQIESFWQKERLTKAVVKPAESGSSIGVLTATTPEIAKKAASQLWDQGFREILVQPYIREIEFTVCVLENRGAPISLIPLEIDFGSGEIFDYRKKYLPSDETRYYCPPRFDQKIIEKIQGEAERLFKALGLRDFARIDGWVSKEGKITFSDLNPISGMEQNSFIFQQASRIGMSHADLIEYILRQALFRYGKELPEKASQKSKTERPVFVLMGGKSSERQVSLLSGTNVWLKLRLTEQYKPVPFLLDPEETVWELPYGFTLHHSVEEMVEHCQRAEATADASKPFVEKIRQRLSLPPLTSIETPRPMSLDAFLKMAEQSKAFVFVALHGGIGEDGTLQKKLEKLNIPFNGSDASASKLCMDKRKTALRIAALKDPWVLPMLQISFRATETDFLWERATARFKTEDLIVKPQQDGCSTGVVRIRSKAELHKYLDLLHRKAKQALPGTFRDQANAIEMPAASQPFILEPFIHTDKVTIEGTQLQYNPSSGWCEMTIGILEKKNRYKALNPSVTVAENHVLSVEEKFQGGTGINLTPPPPFILSAKAREQVQKGARRAAAALGIRGYARLDLFVECKTGRIRVIEANTLPALTPSTVLYHQALSSKPPIAPKELLVSFIQSSRANQA